MIWFPSLNKSQLIKISLKEAGYNDILKLRKYLLETDDVAKAVDAAVISCIKSGILTEFLTKHRAEVLDVCITEFDEKTFVEGIKEEAIEDMVLKMLKNGKSPKSISNFCDIPLDYVTAIKKKMEID